MKFLNLTPLLLLILLSACNRTDDPVINPASGIVQIHFLHTVNEVPLITDTLCYLNSLQQEYMVNDLQYFISAVAFHSCNGNWKTVTTDEGIHYTDIRIVSSEIWMLKDHFTADCYDSLRFIFGLNESDNYSNRFPDPPQRDMFWPEMLGGGYHYMKMNLKWKNENMPQLMPFMFHLGIGQMYAGTTANPDSVIGFIHNHFMVQIPCSFTPEPGQTADLFIRMNLEKWFDGNNAFDFSVYPMGIMQNQAGMHRAVQNGKKAFSAGIMPKNK